MKRAEVKQSVLSENAYIAGDLRRALAASGALALNFISSPGSGKTTLIEKTLELLPNDARVAVLTGDMQTDDDTRRLLRCGHPVRRIAMGDACHLDAAMVEKHLGRWLPQAVQLLLIENVENLVCPTSYDLGEDATVVILSVTEGEDMPLKYPGIFRKAELMILNKIDLLPHVLCRPDAACENARRINPDIEIIETSCTTGEGLGQWMRWLEARAAKKVAASLSAAGGSRF